MLRKQIEHLSQDQPLRKLRREITMLSAGISGLVLLAVVLTALFFTEVQFSNSAKRYLQGTLNAVVARLQTESVISQTWMAQTEMADQMILSISDSGTPLQFSGAWTPKTDREQLLKRAEELAFQQGMLLDSRPLSLLDTASAIISFQGDHGDSYLGGVALVPKGDGWLTVILLRDQSLDQQRLWLFRGAFALLLLLGMGLLVWLCWLVAGRTIRPIAESRKKQVEFVAAASHELRSPLAVIGTSSSALGISPDGDRALRATIQRECARMGRLVDDLLTLARSDAGTWSITLTPVDLDTLLLETAEKFYSITAKKGQTLTLQVPDDTLPTVMGDCQRLEQLLTILLDNACSYTPQSGHIQLSASITRQKILLKVSDDGPGIPPEQRKRIFDRFYRGDPSRSKKEHCGLGLSIAKELAALHGGKLYLEPHSGPGATFVLELPRN